jgi:toxin YoeB
MSPSCPPPSSLGSSRPLTCFDRPETRDVCSERCVGLSEENRSSQVSPNCVERCSVQQEGKRAAVFHFEFREDLRYWVKSDRNTAIRVLDLVEAVMRDPFQGPGKPEPLKYVLAGCWSRRITQEHRLVPRISDEAVDFLQARYHY